MFGSRRSAITGHRRDRHLEPLQFAFQFVDAVLAAPHEHDALGRAARQLADGLGTDRAAGPRHEHRAAIDVVAHGGDVHGHRRAPQQVIDPDLAQQRHLHVASEHLVHAGDDTNRHRRAGLEHERPHPSDEGPVGGSDGDHDLVALQLTHDANEVVHRTDDVYAVDAESTLRRIVVHDRDRYEAGQRMAQHLAHHRVAPSPAPTMTTRRPVEAGAARR